MNSIDRLENGLKQTGKQKLTPKQRKRFAKKSGQQLGRLTKRADEAARARESLLSASATERSAARAGIALGSTMAEVSKTYGEHAEWQEHQLRGPSV